MKELISSPLSVNAISVDDLREDIVVEASAEEKRLIIDNFPNEKNTCTACTVPSTRVYEVRGNYLVVPRVIEEWLLKFRKQIRAK